MQRAGVASVALLPSGHPEETHGSREFPLSGKILLTDQENDRDAASPVLPKQIPLVQTRSDQRATAVM